MTRYAIANVGRLAQAPPDFPSPPKRALPVTVVNSGIVVLGLGMSVAGYYHRKTDLGMISMGAGSSIVGAGIVLLILDLAGIPSSAQV